MSTIFEVMQHNYTHGVVEKGTATLLHPLYNQGSEEPYAYALQFHQTDVVTAYPNGSIVLKSGGWMTPSTRGRMSRYLPKGYSLYPKKGMWLIDTPIGTVEFKDGMALGGALQPYSVASEEFSYN